MQQFLQFTVVGLVTAAIYAVLASGLVVTYTTSGIFNFAHGAVAMMAAFSYWQLSVKWGLPVPLSVALILLVLAPVFGLFLDVVIMRGLEGTSEVIKTVVTVGVLFALIALAQIIWGPNVNRIVEPFFGAKSKFEIFGVSVLYHQLIVIGVAIAVAFGLRLLLFGTRTGVAMRAVVSNRSLVRLNGGRPSRSSATSWALGSSLAALSGIFIAYSVGSLAGVTVDAAGFERLLRGDRRTIGEPADDLRRSDHPRSRAGVRGRIPAEQPQLVATGCRSGHLIADLDPRDHALHRSLILPQAPLLPTVWYG